jgi:hypothetical protein
VGFERERRPDDLVQHTSPPRVLDQWPKLEHDRRTPLSSDEAPSLLAVPPE